MNSTVLSNTTFRYQHVLDKGRPVHDKNDPFFVRHPAMDLGRRAKIFSPFDALKGFGGELAKAQAEVTDSFRDENDPVEEFP